MRARLALSCFLLGVIGCGGEVPPDILPTDAAIDASPDATPVAPVVPVVRVHSWPGMGVQLAVEMPDAVASERPGEMPEAWLETAGGQRIDAVAAPAQVTVGLTAVVILPSIDPGIHAMRQAAADALIRALPAGERVALFVARPRAELLADLSLPRDHARARLAALLPEDVGASALIALRDVRELLDEVSSSHGPLGRTAIVVGATAADDPPEVRRVVQVLTMPVDADPMVAAASMAAQLLARRARIVRVGACAGLAENAPFTLHLGRGYARELYGPAVMEHVVGQPCVADDVAADRYPYPGEINFTFSAEERPIFDQIHASQQEIPFRTSITLGVGAPVAAEAHLRGQGSLNCQRKSFSVTLDGARRRLMPDVATDHFFLISMCLDDHYVGQMFGNQLLQTLDLFAPRMRYVKVRIDGVNRGVYLLMEQPDNALRDGGLAISSVIRRRYDIDNQPAEVKYPNDPVLAAEAAARFESLGDLARYGPVEDLDAALAARVDLDGYTRMLATYALLQNGDFIDEAYFYGSTEVGSEFYRTIGWDTDDLFSGCHGGGGRAIVDRCMLTYCAEAELDYALLRSPATYNRFLRGMDDVLAQLTPALMATTMAAVKDELWRVLDDEETAAALVEIGSPPLAVARAAIQGRMDAMISMGTTNHASLLGRRASCALTP